MAPLVKQMVPARTDPGAVRVMVADDSAVVRGLITSMLGSDPGIEVVASVANGALAVERLARTRDIDVVVLDIEMPVMDGITALSKLLEIEPTLQVVMASTLTQHNAKISLQALERGAADYVPKPSSRDIGGSAGFRRDLLAKVKVLAARRSRLQPWRGAAALASTGRPRGVAGAAVASGAAAPAPRPVLRAGPRARADVIAIGCSTGGPQALAAVLKGLKAETPSQPILITQHMPPTFTTILAEHLQRASGIPCAEGRAGEMLAGGRIYVAPGDHHMLVEAAAGGLRLQLTQDPPENFCRPSVDPMLRSLAVCGRRTLAVVLTGMGSDGLAGCRRLIEAGGTVLAQDQASSVVWGMPGAVATAGLCCAVEPLDRIAAAIIALAKGGSLR